MQDSTTRQTGSVWIAFRVTHPNHSVEIIRYHAWPTFSTGEFSKPDLAELSAEAVTVYRHFYHEQGPRTECEVQRVPPPVTKSQQVYHLAGQRDLFVAWSPVGYPNLFRSAHVREIRRWNHGLLIAWDDETAGRKGYTDLAPGYYVETLDTEAHWVVAAHRIYRQAVPA